jgi:hypothetical protein
MTRIIELIVSPTGETTAQTKGYRGTECLNASKFLEESLGVVTAERKTTEYLQPSQTQEVVNQQQ